MSTGSADLDQLADDHLDELIDAAQWQAAEVTHGEALAAALARARQRRQAIAGLPRPAIDASLRDAILLGVALPKRKPIRFPVWAMGVGISAAAAALVLTVTLRGPTQASPHETTLAQAERATAPATVTTAAESRDAKRTEATPPMQGAERLGDDANAFAALQEQAKAHVDAGFAQADPTAEAPRPHVVELAWATTQPVEGGRITARRQRSLPAAPAQDEQELAMEADTALRETAPASATMAAPAAMNAVEADASTTVAAAPAVLEVLLHNRTVTAWDINADDIRIEALDADGQVIWRGRILAEGVVTVAAGSHARLRIDAAQWPAQTQSLRAVAAQVESRTLPLDAQ